MSVTQLTWDAVTVGLHTTANPTVSHSVIYVGTEPVVVTAHTTGAVIRTHPTRPFIAPSYYTVKTPSPVAEPVTEGIIFPRGVPTFSA